MAGTLQQKHAGGFQHKHTGRQPLPLKHCTQTAPRNHTILFVVSDYESDLECMQVAACIKALRAHTAKEQPTITILDAQSDPQLLGTKLRRAPLGATTTIVTFGMWTTTYVSQFLGCDDVALHCATAGQPLHLYGCSIDPRVERTTWGNHSMRGVRSIPLSYPSLIGALHTLRMHGRRIFVPFDRALFSLVHEAIWPTFDNELTQQARTHGFDVTYIGLEKPLDLEAAFIRAHEGDIILTLPSGGVEPYLERLAILCRDKHLVFCTHSAGPLSYGAALSYSGAEGCFVPEIVKLITQHVQNVPRHKMVSTTLAPISITYNVDALIRGGVHFTPRERFLLEMAHVTVVDTLFERNRLDEEHV